MTSARTSGLAKCGSVLQKAARAGSLIRDASDIYKSAGNIASGNGGVGDYLQIGGAKNCFVGGTDVLTGSLDEGQATFSYKNIEDIKVGDKVWSKDQNNPDAPLELKTVTDVFSHQAYDLQKVSLTDAQGNTEVIESTDEHPYFVDDQGWTGAGELHIGDRVVSSDEQVLVVSANVDDKPKNRITVYNFTVEGDHTYFVSDDAGGVTLREIASKAALQNSCRCP